MRNRSRLTNLVVLAGILTLVGCASARVEYANSHGYYPAWIDGAEYYCTPRPWNSGNNSSTTVNCLTLADIENVRTGKERPQSPSPETVLDLPDGYRRVMINDQQRFCWRTDATAPKLWSCDPSLAVALHRALSRNRAPAPTDWPWPSREPPSPPRDNFGAYGATLDTSGRH